MLLDDPHRVPAPSDQSVGRLFAAAFALLAIWRSQFWTALKMDLWVAVLLALSVVFLLLSQFAPSRLSLLNRLWMGLGALLGRVVSPIVLFVLYVTVIVPAGLLRQWLAKPSIPMGRDETLSSYWVPREPPGPKPETLKRPY